MVPGQENDPLEYPAPDAAFPLNYYQSGIPIGPFRRCNTPKQDWDSSYMAPMVGYVPDDDEEDYSCGYKSGQGGIPTKFEFTIGYGSSSLRDDGITNHLVTYSNGQPKACGVNQYNSKREYITPPSIDNGYIQRITMFGNHLPPSTDQYPYDENACSASFAALRLGYNTSSGHYSESNIVYPSPIHTDVMYNVTMGPGFALTGYGAGYPPNHKYVCEATTRVKRRCALFAPT